MSTPAQIHANKANAQLSTGPRTTEGKTKSSFNAVKTGLTGRTVLLPTEDAAAYQEHIDRFFREHTPAADAERTLVQSLADTEWRLLRIPSLEMGIYAIGRLELESQYSSVEDTATRNALIEAKILLTYGRQLNNLRLQERRLRNQRNEDRAELKRLQDERAKRTAFEISAAMELYREAQNARKPFDFASFGFEFPIAEFERRLACIEHQKAGRSSITADFLARKAA